MATQRTFVNTITRETLSMSDITALCAASEYTDVEEFIKALTANGEYKEVVPEVKTTTPTGTKKLLPNLYLSALKADFKVSVVNVGGVNVVANNLATAISDGTLDKRIKESAAELCGNNEVEVCRALIACVASYKTNMHKAICNGAVRNKAAENLFIETLDAYLKSRIPAQARSTKYAPANAKGKANYDRTDEEIEGMAGNYEALCSVYNSIASKLTKSLNHLAPNDPDVALRDRLIAQQARLAELKAACLTGHKQDRADKIAALSDKLSKKRATLSAAEIETIKSLLNLK